MNRVDFNKHVDKIVEGFKAILCTKGEDYSYADDDRLSNFKETAKEVELTKYNVWYVYFNKGMSSIRRYITKGKVESENIHARILDAINYLILLDAMITEDEQLANAQQIGLAKLADPAKPTFKVGDRVKWKLNEGVITEIMHGRWAKHYRVQENNGELHTVYHPLLSLIKPVEGLRATSLPNNSPSVRIPKFAIHQDVSRFGIKCRVVRIHNSSDSSKEISYDLQSLESESIFPETSEKEIKVL